MYVHVSLGEGSFGKVYVCHSKRGAPLPPGVTGPLPTNLCVKLYTKALSRGEEMKKAIEREFSSLMTLNHHGIVRCVKLFYGYDDISGVLNCIYIVMERAPAIQDGPRIQGTPVNERNSIYGGPAELFRYIVGRGLTSEGITRFIMAQLLSAVYYLHTCQKEPIVHRDLKTENVLVFGEVTTSAGAVPRCKLADFGTARVIPIEQRLSFIPMLTKNNIGSKQYMAPELVSKTTTLGSSSSSSSSSKANEKAKYDEKIDIYSLGITMYAILTSGRLPFTDAGENSGNDSIWIPRMLENKLKWNYIDPVLSEAGKDFIRWMVHVNPSTRFSAGQCLAHEWFDSIRDEYATLFNDPILQRLQRQ